MIQTSTGQDNQSNGSKENLLGHVPQELLEKIRAHGPLESVQAVAGHDLDSRGMYGEGWLVLTEKELGSFHLVESSHGNKDRGRDAHGTRGRGAHATREKDAHATKDQWEGDWLGLDKFDSAVIVEGLGMGILRLLSAGGGKMVAEHRFTLRHVKEVAKLHRRLEKLIAGKEEPPPPEEPKPDEKKVRCDKCGRVIPAWSEDCPACLSRRKVLSRLMDYVKPYKWRAIIGFAMAVVSLAASLVIPYLPKPMLDKGLGANADFGLLLFYIAVMACLMVVTALAGGIRERLMAVLGSRIGRDIRDRTYEHLHKLSLSFFSKKPTGSLVTRITSDSDRIWDFVAFTLMEAMISILTIIGIGVALFIMNWRLACIVLLPVPLMLFLTIVFHKKLHVGFDRLFHRWSQMTAIVSDALPGVRVIKAFSQEKREVERFGRKNEQYFNDEVGMITLWTLFGPVMQFCSRVGALLVWVVGGYWAVRYHYDPKAGYGMTPGTLMSFISYMWMFYGPIHTIAHMDRQLNRAASSVQRIFEILDTQPVIFSKSFAQPVKTIRGSIELRNVSFSYDGIRKVLHNVSLKIEPGEMIGLAGPSGGGKSTLINLICRLYDVLEGQILIDGVDVRDYDIESLRRRIGVVLQEPFLFHGTVAKNIAYGHPEATIDEIITASRAANAHDFIVGFPDGYDTLVGERGHTLSGGERQRISIARAILSNPSVLILDEATSSVDTETEKLIQEALDRLVANRTTIAIAHRLSTLSKADRLVILEKGKIVEEGPHGVLAAKPDGLYAKLLRMQTEMQSIIAIG